MLFAMLTQEPRAAAKEMRRMRMRGVIPHRLNGVAQTAKRRRAPTRPAPAVDGQGHEATGSPLPIAVFSTPAKARVLQLSVLRQGGAHALTWQAFAGKDCP